MNKILWSAAFLTLVVIVGSCKNDHLYGGEERLPYVFSPHDTVIIPNIPGYLSWLPGRYALPGDNNKQYPVIIWLHGGGGFGNGGDELTFVTRSAERMFGHATQKPSWRIGDTTYSFLQFAPQFRSYPTSEEIHSFIFFIEQNYRVDKSRIYLVGFSLGGKMASDYAAQYPLEIATLITLAGCMGSDVNKSLEQKCLDIANAGLPVWAFHNIPDATWPVGDSKRFFDTLMSYNLPPAPRLSLFITQDESHDCWTKASDPNYKESGSNIYEWMLFHKR